MFLETSALTGENVEEAFLKCSRTILTKIEAGIAYFIDDIKKWRVWKAPPANNSTHKVF